MASAVGIDEKAKGAEATGHHFELEYDLNLPVPGPLALHKYRSKKSGMTTYFVDMDTQVINGYFCFGTDQPEAIGIEQLLHQLDSSGGLLPRAMRGDMLRPAWQFHGAENPLADRDESCYVCCALGESAFLGTFSCSLYLLQNLEAVLELHGYPYPYMSKEVGKPVGSENPPAPRGEGEGPSIGDDLSSADAGPSEDKDEGPEVEPTLDAPYYCLSEAGEGAMAWEATLQSMFPGVKSFWNRLLSDGRAHRLGDKMRKCFDSMYRPENMSVIITGALDNREQILEMLSDHELDFFETHLNLPPFSKPWSSPLPERPSAVSNQVRFIPRNSMRSPNSTVCIGWRGCDSADVETSMALKVLTAHIAVGPLWTKLVTAGYAHRISWCQLEYLENCSLITIHALSNKESVEQAVRIFEQTLKELVADPNGNDGLNLADVQRMADRVGWHYIRETESDPFLVVASAIAKAERYGEGSMDQVRNRIFPRGIVDSLREKPKAYWMNLLQKYFIDNGYFSTQVIPVDEDMEKEVRMEEQKALQEKNEEKPSFEMQYAEGSRRAASKPRRKANNAVGEESNIAVDEDGRNNNVLPKPAETAAECAGAGALSQYEGPLEEQLKENPFPFGQHQTELDNFEQRMEVTKQFLRNVRESTLRYWNVTSYQTDGRAQHPIFPVNDMPMFTFLDNTNSAFVYMTVALDTTGLDDRARRFLAPVTAALGAFICPRPPALDTDAEIEGNNEFNPPMYIADSQVSLGLNGESTQNVFLTTIVRPENYKWAIGLLHHILYDATFTTTYLKFIAKEAVRGLAANYKMQKPEAPNYECFDSGEINLHGLISLIYKEESNARLFVGRRRLDLMMEYLAELEKAPEAITKETNDCWRQIVDGKKAILQIAGNVNEMARHETDLVGPWKSIFGGKQKSLVLREIQLTSEPDVMLAPAGKGVIIELSEPRAPCLSLAIPINPNSPDFPKLCMAAQMFSMAQKWIWSCWGLDDVCSPVLRMPCSYANLMTLNLECLDVMGSLAAMKMMMKDDWPWLETLLTATKLMVINDPATLELGSQGSIMSALLSHINEQTIESRRTLLKDSMNVTLEDVKEVINKHLVKLFEPSNSWCSVMVYKPESEPLIARIRELGYDLSSRPVNELCRNI